MQEAQQNQAAVDGGLDYIESQQKQLDELLSYYEKQIGDFTNDASKPLASKQPADKEREKA